MNIGRSTGGAIQNREPAPKHATVLKGSVLRRAGKFVGHAAATPLYIRVRNRSRRLQEERGYEVIVPSVGEKSAKRKETHEKTLILTDWSNLMCGGAQTSYSPKYHHWKKRAKPNMRHGGWMVVRTLKEGAKEKRSKHEHKHRCLADRNCSFGIKQGMKGMHEKGTIGRGVASRDMNRVALTGSEGKMLPI
ncbi:hypothetical protein BJV74DRAFT_793590 [Russula compacta]|nr:hypothetical protein BJV74DRAFT_793590 [Russula compacta]